MIGTISPGHSPVHRLPTGLKLAVLAIAVTVIALQRDPIPLLVALGCTIGLFALARVRLRVALRAISPVLWLLLVAVPLNALFGGWESAALMGLRVGVAVALAALFSLTTSVSSILDTIARLLRPFPKIDADRVGLVLALTIRSIPLLADIVAAVMEARRARGAERSLRAIAVPVIVRSLQTADELGDALVARGADD